MQEREWVCSCSLCSEGKGDSRVAGRRAASADRREQSNETLGPKTGLNYDDEDDDQQERERKRELRESGAIVHQCNKRLRLPVVRVCRARPDSACAFAVGGGGAVAPVPHIIHRC